MLMKTIASWTWSAPAERSGDGALAWLAQHAGEAKAGARFACPRTPSPVLRFGGSWGATLALFVLGSALAAARAGQSSPTSRTINSVLHEPLPAEELSLSESAAEFVVSGPTFTYRIQKATGAVSGIRVVHEGQEVITASIPADRDCADDKPGVAL
jgi:hypothetical protein